MTECSDCVIVMAKIPKSGHVKTRLAVSLGDDKALSVYLKLLKATLNTVTSDSAWHCQLWGDSNGDNDCWVQAGIDTTAYEYHCQQGDNLGERMQFALQTALKKYKRCVVVGTDCPAIDRAYIAQAFLSLSTHSAVVLGPAEDGGYVLLGMGDRVVDVFSGVSWGSDSVLEDTRRHLRTRSIPWQELSTLRDIDRLEDLQFYSDTIKPE